MNTVTLPEDFAMPRVTIVVPCRNEIRFIDSFLEMVLSQDDPGGGYEVIVADGSSDDGTSEHLEKISQFDERLRVLTNPQGIASTGLNAAIRDARGEIVVRMDVHATYDKSYVRNCVEVLEASGADNVGGPAGTRAVSYIQRGIAAAYHSPFSVGGAKFHEVGFEGDVDTVVYGCWRKDTLVRLGLFDEELIRNQDDELNFRIRKMGGRCFQSQRIKSWYVPRDSLGGLFRQYMQYGYWKVRVIKKHGRPSSIRHLVPVIFAAGILFGWLGGFLHPGLFGIYLVCIFLYGSLSVLFSVKAALKAGMGLLPILPIVFLIYHLSYGIGFALGMIDMVTCGWGSRSAMSSLTRG